MTENNRIEISLGKTKLMKLLFFSMLFFLAGLWMIIINPQINNPIFNNSIVKTIVSYGSALMGAWGIYFFSKKILDKKPGLVLSELGIYDNTSAFRFGLIPWTDIFEISESSIQASFASKQHFVTIGLVNPDQYISRETNILKRKILIANSKSYGSPIHISSNGLTTSHKDLFNLMTDYFTKYKKAA